jgi:ATP adenylyltransferase/5',5'''-P-1,P-4-tetraphosphate phosphorylase II
LQLNKYSVVEEHFLLVTKGVFSVDLLSHAEIRWFSVALFCFVFFDALLRRLLPLEFQSQTSPLRPGDLVQAYLLLRAAREAGKHLFAFYNCASLRGGYAWIH